MFQFKIQRPTARRLTFLLVQILVGGTILLAARQLYFSHTYYRSFLNSEAQNLLNIIFWAMLTSLTLSSLLRVLFQQKLPVTKLSLIFALILKSLYSLVQFINGSSQRVKVVIDRDTKIALLSLLVKFYYIPLMVSFFIGNYHGLMNNVQVASRANLTFEIIFDLLVSALFTIDILIFTFGYIFESDVLNNRIRSVEPTVLGWVAALSTYPPFNGITSQFIFMVTGAPTFLGANIHTNHIIKIGILLCHFTFVSASVALGTKASNLTNRGIVAKGPYAIIRHPAYLAKLTAWFLEGLLFAPNFGYFIGWAGFAAIYSVRAITEERHLSQDPDYVRYKQKIRWRIIPGLI
jgi:protein-S-isoprenylcysteine O-methyltransferase Ste14